METDVTSLYFSSPCLETFDRLTFTLEIILIFTKLLDMRGERSFLRGDSDNDKCKKANTCKPHKRTDPGEQGRGEGQRRTRMDHENCRPSAQIHAGAHFNISHNNMLNKYFFFYIKICRLHVRLHQKSTYSKYVTFA